MEAARGEVGGFRAVLRQRPLVLALTAYLLGLIGLGTTAVVVSIGLYERTGQPIWATVGAMVTVVPFVLCSSAAGVMGDRFEQRRVMLAAFTLVAGTALVLGLGAAHWPVAIVATIGFAAHLAWTPVYPALAAFTPSAVDSEDLAAAVSLMSAVDSVGWIVGPGLGGVLISLASLRTAALVAAATAVAAAAVTLANLRSSTAAVTVATEDRTPFRQAYVDGVRVLRQSAAARAPLLLLLVVDAVYGAMQVLLVIAATDRLSMSEGGFGALSAAIGAGGLAALLLVNRLSRARRPIATLCATLLCSAVPLGVLALVSAPPIAIVLLGLSGVGTVLTEVLAITALQRSVPQDALARVFGILDTLITAAVLIGSLAAPILVRVAGLRWALAATGIVVPLAAAFTIPRFTRRGDQLSIDLIALEPRVRVLTGLPVLRHASRSAIEALARQTVEETIPAGTTVFHQGEPADDFFAVVSGTFGIVRDGREVDTEGPGGGFGHVGILRGLARNASVIANTDATIVRVPGALFLRAVGPGRINAGAGVSTGLRDYVSAG